MFIGTCCIYMQYVKEINAHTSGYLIRCFFDILHLSKMYDIAILDQIYMGEFFRHVAFVSVFDQMHRWSDLRDRQRAPIQMFGLANALRNEELCADIYSFNFSSWNFGRTLSLKGLASYCKAETTFTFYFSILTLSCAFLSIDNIEMWF